MKRIIRFAKFIITITLVSAASTNAQIGSLPEAGFGAHGMALGRSAMASPHDALSGSWNPASITGLEKITATAFYSKSPFDAIHSSYGIVIPTRKHGYFGVSFFHIRIGGIDIRDVNGQKTGEASFKNNHLLLTYGKVFANALALGFNLKLVQLSLVQHEATLENPGVDLGLLYRFHSAQPLLRNFALGIAIDNLIKPTLQLSRVSEALPREARLVAEKELRAGDGKFTLLSNFAFTEAGSYRDNFKLHWGVEYSHKSVFALRTGYDGTHMSAGAGLKFKGIILDYALNNWLVEADDLLSPLGAFSLTYQF